jgi:peptidoglycan/xylan/chitin deacetylase (PgdA/CDA1 family)
VLSKLPTMSVGRVVRGSIWGQAVISMAASALLAAGGTLAGPQAAHVAAPPKPVITTTARESVATHVRVEHCQSRGPQVWLTFDDGGSAQQVGRILSVLRSQHVQAIFFPIGSWAEANPGIVARISHEGQLIGDHTHDHIDLNKANDTRASWQIRHGRTHTVGTVPLLRPPFGAGAYTQRLDDIAASLGMQLCTWTVDTRDWTGSSAAKIIRRVRHGDAITPPVRAGGVVIMHMNGDHTGRALPGVIHAIRARGLHLHALPR